MPTSRRTFIRNSALTAGLAISLPGSLAAEMHASLDAAADPLVVLFQGDSITDAGRNRENSWANNGNALGSGYANMAAAMLMARNPSKKFEIYNRGISGNKVFQLRDRWQADCLDLKPDILSILIGVNDFWHTLTHDYEGTAEVYEADFRALLEQTQKALPNIKLIIGEPFVIKGGKAIDEAKWFPAFEAYQMAAQKIATEFGAAWIPYQSIFDKAVNKASVKQICPDGVHPSPAGGYLMAEAWMKAMKKAMK